MRLIIHTKVGTFIHDDACQLDKLTLELTMRSYSETFDFTCRAVMGDIEEHRYTLPSAGLYFSVEDEDGEP